MSNFFADFRPDAGDDNTEQEKLAAWAALAGKQPDQQGPMSREGRPPVRLPEVDVATPDVAAGPGALPPVPQDMAPPRQVNLPQVDIQASPQPPPVPQDMAPPPPFEARPPEVSDAVPPPAAPPAAAQLSPVAQMGQAIQAPSPSQRSDFLATPAPNPQEPTFPPPSRAPDEPSSGNHASPWAVLADTLLNRGRGIGTILALGAENGDKEQLQRAELDLKRAQAAHLRQPTDPAVLAYKQEQIELAKKRIENAQNNINGVQQRFDEHRTDVNDPNSQHNTTQVSVAGQRAAATTEAHRNTEHQLIDQTAADASRTASAETAGRLDTTLNFAPATAAAAASQAEQVAAAGQRGANPGRLNYESNLTPILNERANSGAGAGMDADMFIASNPNIKWDNGGDQLKREWKTRGGNKIIIDKADAANRGNGIIQGLHDTADAYDALPTDQRYGPKGYALITSYDGLKEEYGGVMQKLGGDQNKDAKARALAQVPSIHLPHQYLMEGIGGLWTPIETNVAGNLRSLGGTPMPPAFMQEQAAEAAAAQPPPTAAVPQPTDMSVGPPVPDVAAAPRAAALPPPQPVPIAMKHDSAAYNRDGLPTAQLPMPGAQAPLTQGDARSQTRSYKVTLPGGRVIHEDLTPAQAEAARHLEGVSVQ